MFTGKHASPELNAASERCFSPAMALFRSELTGMVAFATLHGIAALVNRGLLRAEDLEALVDEAVEQMATRSVGGIWCHAGMERDLASVEPWERSLERSARAAAGRRAAAA